jgi:hypothetical protein
MADLMQYPMQLNYTEELDMFAVTGTTETMYGAVLLSDGPVVKPPLNGMFTVHATSATTLTAGAFTTWRQIRDYLLDSWNESLSSSSILVLLVSDALRVRGSTVRLNVISNLSQVLIGSIHSSDIPSSAYLLNAS